MRSTPRALRLSVTARIALLAIVLALVTNLSLGAFVWQWTHSDAIDTLRRNTIEQSETLAAVYRRGGAAELDGAIADARVPGDTSLIVARYGRDGRLAAGRGPARAPGEATAGRFRIGKVGTGFPWAQRDAGVMLRRIGDGWLLSGRLLDEWQAAQRAIERALAISVLLSLGLGVAGGLILARYVTRRLDLIAGTVDAVGEGDLARRVAIEGAAFGAGSDAFDRLAARLNAMLGKIERLMGEVRVITDGLAHDLRSPLARLRARAEAAALPGVTPVQREAALGGLLAETDLVMRMLDTLLEISRSEAMTRDRFVVIAPGEVIAGIAELYEPLAEDAGLRLTVEIAPDAPPMALHRELLSQAIANLIDNALKYAGEGGEMTLSLERASDEVRIALADRGPGIAPDQRAQALRRFGRLDLARSAPGAGLGLALVEAVARLHGGRLELAGNDPGLRAIVVLPHRAHAAAALDSSEANP